MVEVSMWGDAWVRGSIWLALLAYPAGPWSLALPAGPRRRLLLGVWSVGAMLFWIHVWGAFEVFYAWSQHIALEETSRQVEALTGRGSGWGLYLNYLFGLLWTFDVVRGWRISQRAPGLSGYAIGFHAFFLFMIFNATVVFEEGATRVMGAVVCFAAVAGLVRARRISTALGKSVTGEPS